MSLLCDIHGDIISLIDCIISHSIAHIYAMKRPDLARKHLERRFAPLRAVEFAAPPRGWLRAIREAIGMTAEQLASRREVATSRIYALEKAEVTGATTLNSLREAA